MGRQALQKLRIENSKTIESWVGDIKDEILEHGFAHIRMPQLLKMVGVSRATFYNHVESRDALIAHILTAQLQEIGSFAQELRMTTRSYKERYHEAVAAACVSIAGVSSRFLADVRDHIPELWKQVEAFRNFAQDELTRFYQEGQNQGYLKSCDPSLLALADRIMIEGLSNPELIQAQSISLVEMVKHYFDTRAQGIFADA